MNKQITIKINGADYIIEFYRKPENTNLSFRILFPDQTEDEELTQKLLQNCKNKTVKEKDISYAIKSISEILKTIIAGGQRTLRTTPNTKGQVQEIIQRNGDGDITQYLTTERIGGPSHNPVWEATVCYGNVIGCAKGAGNKTEIEKLACADFLETWYAILEIE